MASNGGTSESPGSGTLATAPAAGQVISHEGRDFDTVKEGLAHILNPRTPTSASSAATKQAPKKEDQPQTVFYNPIQQFNRDLSVLAIRAYGEHTMTIKAEKIKRSSARREAKDGAGSRKGKKRKREDESAQELNGHGNSNDNDKTVLPTTQPKAGDSAPNVHPGPETSKEATVTQDQPKAPAFTILDALSASGLRALRYAKELPFVTRVVANDLSASAIDAMRLNIQYNKVDDVVYAHKGDARAFMYSILSPPKPTDKDPIFGKFDVIDLDPYGTAAPFMDAAVQAVSDQGLLCVTCTDAGVFASNGYPEKAYALYGGTPLKGAHSHEGGLRLILNALASSAAKYGLAIEPLLSLSIDFYARVFVRVHRSPAAVKFAAGRTMIVYSCDYGCGAWATQPLAIDKLKTNKNGTPFYNFGYAQGPSTTPNCEHCGSKTHLSGPMWAGPLHNPHFIRKILNLLPGADREIYPTVDRIEGMLWTALEEDLDLGNASAESTPEPGATDKDAESPSLLIPRTDPASIEKHPFFFLPSYLCKVLHAQTIPDESLRNALANLGYRSTRSHMKPGSVRTDAPWDVIWEIIREWVRQKAPIKEESLKDGSPGARIMRRRRDNLNIDGTGDAVRTLKLDLISAVESGKDISELVTKVEAALYRSGCRHTSENKESSHDDGLLDDPKTASSKSVNNHSGAEQLPPSKLNVVFDESVAKSRQVARKKKLTRYQFNPRPNWGPQSRATGM